MSESVEQRLAAPHDDSRTLIPSLCGRMGSERIQQASERIKLLWTQFPARVTVAPTPSVFGEAGQGNGIGDQRIIALVSVLQTTVQVKRNASTNWAI